MTNQIPQKALCAVEPQGCGILLCGPQIPMSHGECVEGRVSLVFWARTLDEAKQRNTTRRRERSGEETHPQEKCKARNVGKTCEQKWRTTS